MVLPQRTPAETGSSSEEEVAIGVASELALQRPGSIVEFGNPLQPDVIQQPDLTSAINPFPAVLQTEPVVRLEDCARPDVVVQQEAPTSPADPSPAVQQPEPVIQLEDCARPDVVVQQDAPTSPAVQQSEPVVQPDVVVQQKTSTPPVDPSPAVQQPEPVVQIEDCARPDVVVQQEASTSPAVPQPEPVVQLEDCARPDVVQQESPTSPVNSSPDQQPELIVQKTQSVVQPDVVQQEVSASPADQCASNLQKVEGGLGELSLEPVHAEAVASTAPQEPDEQSRPFSPTYRVRAAPNPGFMVVTTRPVLEALPATLRRLYARSSLHSEHYSKVTIASPNPTAADVINIDSKGPSTSAAAAAAPAQSPAAPSAGQSFVNLAYDDYVPAEVYGAHGAPEVPSAERDVVSPSGHREEKAEVLLAPDGEHMVMFVAGDTGKDSDDDEIPTTRCFDCEDPGSPRFDSEHPGTTDAEAEQEVIPDEEIELNVVPDAVVNVADILELAEVGPALPIVEIENLHVEDALLAAVPAPVVEDIYEMGSSPFF